MNAQLIFFAAFSCITSACQTTAPSHYELNRRSGLSISVDDPASQTDSTGEVGQIRTGRLPSKDAFAPARTAPVIEKVWVYDQIINDGQWLQGTWIFLEVEKAKWLPEIDIGQGSFLETGKVQMQSSERGTP
jgi:hypothetical protein